MVVSMMTLLIMVGNTQLSFATDYDWTGSAKESVLASTSSFVSKVDGNNAHDFFLYNVGAKKFVFQGGDWGTQPILDANKATRFNLSYDNIGTSYTGSVLNGKRYYAFTSNVGSSTGNWLGFKVENDIASLWLDCSSESSTLAGNYGKYKYVCWNLQDDMSTVYNPTGYHTYTIRALFPAGGIDGDHKNETYYLYYDKDNDQVIAKNYHKYCTSPEDSVNIDPYAMWRLVTVNDIITKLGSLTSVDIDDPFNCTYFLKDPYLSRCSSENTNWKLRCGNKSGNDALDHGGDTGLKLGIDTLFSSKLDSDTKASRYGGTGLSYSKNPDGNNKFSKEYGKYFCGQVKGYPSSSTSNDLSSFYQELTIPVTGWYRVSCQGFVSTSDNESYLYAKNQSDERQFRYVRLNNINDFEILGKGHDKVAKNLTEAALMFYDEQYPNQVYIYMQANQKLELGLRFRGNNEWAAFDDFGLAFCGNTKAALLLDEDKTNLSHITNAHSSYNNFEGYLLDLHRTFVTHKWNTIVLPVSLTQRQCQELFGSGTKVAELTDYDSKTGTMKFNRVEHKQTDNEKIVIEANKPYIIKPTSELQSNFQDTWDTQAYTKDVLTYNHKDGSSTISVTVPFPFRQTLLSKALKQKADVTYMSETDYDNTNNMLSLPGVTMNGLTFHGTLTKTYEDKTEKFAMKDKYIIYDGKIYYVEQAYGMDGMRGYFSFDNLASAAKSMKFSVDEVEESADNITGIEGILLNKFASTKNFQGNKVYNLSGQVVSTQGSTDNLPKGIYIIKGKKVLVK